MDRKVKDLVIDFFALFGSSLGNKFIGLFREIIIASFFGASPSLAAYLILRTGVDFLSMLGGVSALQGNIVPRFSRLFKEFPELACLSIYNNCIRIGVALTCLSIIILLGVTHIYSYWDLDYLLFIILLLGVTVGVLFNNQMGLLLTQSKGEFRHYAKVELFNYGIAILLLYPLTQILGILGVVLSRFIGIASMHIYSWKKILLDNNIEQKSQAKLKKSDFNFYVVIASNFSLILILFARAVIGKIGSEVDVIHFYYAILILNLLTTSVGRSISSILLQKSSLSNITNGLGKLLLLSFVIIAPIIIIIYCFAENISILLLEYGNYSYQDAILTARVIKIALPLFVLHFYTMILLQPILSNKNESGIRISETISFILGLSILVYIFSIELLSLNQNSIYYFLYIITIIISYIILKFYLNTKTSRTVSFYPGKF